MSSCDFTLARAGMRACLLYDSRRSLNNYEQYTHRMSLEENNLELSILSCRQEEQVIQ